MKGFKDRFKEGVELLVARESELFQKISGAQEAHLKHVKQLDPETRKITEDEIVISVRVWKKFLHDARKYAPKDFYGFRVEIALFIPPPPQKNPKKKKGKKYPRH